MKDKNEKRGKATNMPKYLVPGTEHQVHIFRGVAAVATDADRPTRTLTLTRTLWGDLCLDAVECQGSVNRLIRPKGEAVDGGRAFQNSRTTGCAYHLFGKSIITTPSVCVREHPRENPTYTLPTTYTLNHIHTYIPGNICMYDGRFIYASIL